MTGSPEERILDFLDASDLGAFRAFVADCPEVFGPETLAELRRLAEAPAYGAPFSHLAELVAVYPDDPEAAWKAFEHSRREGQELASRAGALADRVDEADAAGDRSAVVELALEAARVADSAGLGLLACDMLARRGRALAAAQGPERRSAQREAIDCLQAALEIAPQGERRADRLMDLANVYADRIDGDRAENQEMSLRLSRDAIQELEEHGTDLEADQAADTLAMYRTNLSVSLLRSERGERIARVSEARALCEGALRHRSLARDARDWTFSMLNLGEALFELARHDAAEIRDSVDVFREVAAHASEVSDDLLVGTALHAIGRVALWEAAMSAEDIVDEYQGATSPPPVVSPHEGVESLREAEALLLVAEDSLVLARVRADLSRLLGRMDQIVEALEYGLLALEILGPANAPRACAELGASVGGLLADEARWEEAARAFEVALLGSDLAFHSRLDTRGRNDELRTAGTLGRWSAFVLAKVGAPDAALLALEMSRAHEFRRRLGPEAYGDQASALPDDLRERLDEAATKLRQTPVGKEDEAARTFQQVIAEIREVEGLEDFAIRPQVADLAKSVTPEWPLVYVNPTPWGTLLLVLTVGTPTPKVEAHVFEYPRAMDLFMRLITGEDALTDDAESGDGGDEVDGDELEDGGSYLLALLGAERASVAAGLDASLAWLGENVAVCVWRAIEDLRPVGVTIVPCGPVATTPLHAAPWEEADSEVCLLDRCGVRYAPAATVIRASLDRANTVGDEPVHLVAVADPTGDLPGARGEVEQVAKWFEKPEVAVGADATRAFVLRAERASHLHLACHASGGLIEDSDAAVLLADGPLSGEGLTGLAGFNPRLVAVSACESALSEMSGVPGEMFSLGVATLVAGSACAVASLWSVDDLATAMLMTRMYDRMFGDSMMAPPMALRDAQLWLRDLTEVGERDFLTAHPALAAEFRRRGVSSILRRPGNACNAPGRGLEVRHPELWAGFVAIGA